ncbi:MAG TPA: GNAT family N-acetyltransferase [Caulobacteraceae bacterium]|jgi:RimJ/RimL family protein N-acetyltransferase
MSGTCTAPVLTTARLRLRPLVPEDAPRIADLAADYEIARMTLRMPHPYAPEDAEAFVRRCADEDPRREITLLIEEPGEGAVGVLGFFEDDEQDPKLGTELGYWIGRPFWGRGYASEAVAEALRWSDQSWRRRLVVAGHFADNPTSARVLVKTGFLYTGVTASRFSRARGEAAPIRMMIRLA